MPSPSIRCGYTSQASQAASKPSKWMCHAAVLLLLSLGLTHTRTSMADRAPRSSVKAVSDRAGRE